MRLSRMRSTQFQLILLAGFTIASGGLSALFDYHPRAALSLMHLGRGLVAAPLLIALVALLHAVLLGVGRFGHAQALAVEQDLLRRAPRTARIAAGITVACGEELFLRVYLFGYLALHSLFAAFGVNALVVGVLYFRGSRRLSWTAVRVAEGSFAAYIYYSQHSFVGLVVARAISYAILTGFTLSRYSTPLLSASTQSWRHPHALFRKALEGTSKRRYASRSI